MELLGERGLGVGQGAGDWGHHFSPLPAPCGEGTQALPSPQKEVMAVRMPPARPEHIHSQSCTRVFWVSAPQGLLLENGGESLVSKPGAPPGKGIFL